MRLVGLGWPHFVRHWYLEWIGPLAFVLAGRRLERLVERLLQLVGRLVWLSGQSGEVCLRGWLPTVRQLQPIGQLAGLSERKILHSPRHFVRLDWILFCCLQFVVGLPERLVELPGQLVVRLVEPAVQRFVRFVRLAEPLRNLGSLLRPELHFRQIVGLVVPPVEQPPRLAGHLWQIWRQPEHFGGWLARLAGLVGRLAGLVEPLLEPVGRLVARPAVRLVVPVVQFAELVGLPVVLVERLVGRFLQQLDSGLHFLWLAALVVEPVELAVVPVGQLVELAGQFVVPAEPVGKLRLLAVKLVELVVQLAGLVPHFVELAGQVPEVAVRLVVLPELVGQIPVRLAEVLGIVLLRLRKCWNWRIRVVRWRFVPVRQLCSIPGRFVQYPD